MSRIINTAKVLRRNWKKSTFFFGVFAYGVSYFKDKFQTHQMMRAYCEEARKYGEKPLSQLMKPRHVTVILNPEANYKKSNVQYEKFAAPLLHLAGFKVSVFQTENERQAKDLMQVMSNTDAVIVAGGNGTLQEAVTGLLMRPNIEGETIPLGIVPLGKTNTIAEYLFGDKSSSRAQLMAEAVMAVIKETTVKLDVLKVQYQDDESPVFAMCNFEQGIFADVDLLVQKYWYLGSLKEKFTYFINSLKEWQPIENYKMEYVAPCSGCSKCYVATKEKEKIETPNRWWHVFLPRAVDTKVVASADPNAVDLSTRINEDCGKRIELSPEYSTISVASTVVDTHKSEKSGSFAVKIFPKDLSIKQFITSGLSHRKSKQVDSTETAYVVEARELIIEVSPPTKSETNQNTEEQSSKTEIPTSDNSTSADPTNSVNGESYDVNNSGQSELESIQSDTEKSSTVSSDTEKSTVSCDTEKSNVSSDTAKSTVSFDTEKSNVSSNTELSMDGYKMNITTDLGTTDSTTDQISFEHVQVDVSESEKEAGVSSSDDSSQPTTVSEPGLNEAASSNETEAAKSSEKMEQYSYIDHEKYRRASCKISVLPKQVTIFG